LTTAEDKLPSLPFQKSSIQQYLDKILRHFTSSQQIKFAARGTSHVIFFLKSVWVKLLNELSVFLFFRGRCVQGEDGYQMMNDETPTVHSPFAKTLTQSSQSLQVHAVSHPYPIYVLILPMSMFPASPML